MKNIFIKDKNSELGFIRISCSIIGALFISYVLMMIISKLLTFSIFENIVLVVIILPILWCIIGLWIVLSETKINAILKTIVPFFIFLIILYFL